MAAAALLAACRATPAQLVVVVDADYSPSEMTCVEIAAVDPSTGTVMDVERVPVADVGLPFSVGVLPPGGDASRAVRVRVSGLRPGATPCPAGEPPDASVLVVRSVQTGFRAGTRLRLPIFLSRACETVWRDCPATQTCVPECSGAACGAGACRSDDVPASELEPIEPGAELTDAGARDAGDRRDGGPSDGGPGPCADALVARGLHTCVVLAATGTTRCWGDNSGGQLGNGSIVAADAPVLAPGGCADAIDTGGHELYAGRPQPAHTCVLRGGTLSCLGSREYGQLGDGTVDDGPLLSANPVALGGGVTGFALGDFHTCAIHGGALSCWGRNLDYAVGSMMPENIGTPQLVSLTEVLLVDAGAWHTCAHTVGGVYCWGSDAEGQLAGTSSTLSNTPEPQRVTLPSAPSALCLGQYISCAIIDTGQAYCWGHGDYLGAAVPSGPGQGPAPIVVGGEPVVSMACANNHACAVDAAGAVFCFGYGDDGQLGVSATYSQMPVRVPGIDDARIVAAGAYHTCVLRTGGSVWCWGSDAHGQLGDGPRDSTGPAPVEVVGL